MEIYMLQRDVLGHKRPMQNESLVVHVIDWAETMPGQKPNVWQCAQQQKACQNCQKRRVERARG